MLQRVLADLVVAVHFAFIVFVVTGGLLALWRPRVAWVHVPVFVWGGLIMFTGWICPLTPLEQQLRRAAGEGGYEGGFIDHYLVPVIYPAGLTRAHQIGLGIFVLVLNLAVYATLVLRRRRASDPRPPR